MEILQQQVGMPHSSPMWHQNKTIGRKLDHLSAIGGLIKYSLVNLFS